jgi:intracellular septation protein
MFLSAALNLIAAMSFSVTAWSAFMSVWAVASKIALFLISYATTRYVGTRRHRAQLSPTLP